MLAFTLEPIRLEGVHIPQCLAIGRQTATPSPTSRQFCMHLAGTRTIEAFATEINIFEYDHVSLSVTMHLTHCV